MPAPLENAIRVEIVERHQRGESLRSISQEMRLSYESVKGIWQHWKRTGQIAPAYEKAKRRGTRKYATVYQKAIQMKQEHPGWGAQLIVLELQKAAPQGAYPSVRTLQRWFRQAGITRPQAERRKGKGHVKRGQTEHSVWAIDAKEQLTLADQSGASWLLISDEASGAILYTEAFPPEELDTGTCAVGTKQSENGV